MHRQHGKLNNLCSKRRLALQKQRYAVRLDAAIEKVVKPAVNISLDVIWVSTVAACACKCSDLYETLHNFLPPQSRPTWHRKLNYTRRDPNLSSACPPTPLRSPSKCPAHMHTQGNFKVSSTHAHTRASNQNEPCKGAKKSE